MRTSARTTPREQEETMFSLLRACLTVAWFGILFWAMALVLLLVMP